MTRREQALLAGVAFAIILGAVSLYFYGNRAPARADVPSRSKIPVLSERPENAGKSPSPPPAAPSVAQASSRAEGEPISATTPPPPAETEQVAVAVVGAVRREGLYRLSTDARVNDLIEKAGGATPEADLSLINLAAPLIDGTTLSLPRKSEWTEEKGVVRGHSATPVANPPQYLLSYVVHPETASPVQPEEASTPASTVPTAEKKNETGPDMVDLNTATTEALEALPGIGPKTAQAIIAGRPYNTVDQLLDVKGIGPKKMEQLLPFVKVQ